MAEVAGQVQDLLLLVGGHEDLDTGLADGLEVLDADVVEPRLEAQIQVNGAVVAISFSLGRAAMKASGLCRIP